MVITELQISESLGKQLQFIASRQIPFAVAASLTATAQIAQSHVRDHINDAFTIRKKSGGFASSIAIRPATKQNLAAEVYTMARFATLQQIGGIRKPRENTLAVPLYSDIGQIKLHRSARDIRDAFMMKLSDGQDAIVQRTGKGLKFLYFLRKQADVPKRFKMIETVIQTAKIEFERKLAEKLDKISS